MEKFFKNYIKDTLKLIEDDKGEKIKNKKQIVKNSLSEILDNDYLWQIIDETISRNIEK